MHDPDATIRRSAFAALAHLIATHGEVLSWTIINSGFVHDGRPMRFANRPRGIFRPKEMTFGALSIKTTVPREGRVARYDDLAHDGGFTYRFQGDDVANHDNVALENTFIARAPLIYFYGIAPGHYLPLWPAYIARFDPRALTCEIVVGTAADLASPPDLPALRDATALAKPRWEHAILRVRTLAAWEHRCAVCDATARPLLDATLVWPDAARRGVPSDDNALALCLLHREVFDRDLLGLDPAGRVHLAPALRDADDRGVVLSQALRPFDGAHVRWPGGPSAKPRESFLASRFERFLRSA